MWWFLVAGLVMSCYGLSELGWLKSVRLADPPTLLGFVVPASIAIAIPGLSAVERPPTIAIAIGMLLGAILTIAELATFSAVVWLVAGTYVCGFAISKREALSRVPKNAGSSRWSLRLIAIVVVVAVILLFPLL
jgi:hypothetical protein